MQVSLSATGGLERRMEVAVPASEVAAEIDQRLKQISRTARLKGFRPGKAPFAVIRKQYGDQVRAEVVSDLMRSSYAQAINQEKLQPAAGPRIEALAMPPENDLKYAAIFEVLPEIKVKSPYDVAIERPGAEITEQDLDAMIESMRRQRPNFTAVERAAQETDRVTLDFEGKIDGQPFEGGEGRDVPLIVGAGQTMAELDAGVRGAKAGDRKTISVAFPAEHPNKNLAGRAAELDVTVKSVEEQTLPAVDEEFCRAYGVEEGGIEALRAEVRKSMDRELAGVVRNRLRTQVMDALYRDNLIEVPRTLIDENVQQLQVDMGRRMGAKDVSQLPPREQFEESARRRVALGLLLGQIVQNEGLKVDRERVLARLNDLIVTYPNPEEARRAYLQNPDAMKQIESSVLEDQVVDWVLERARITDKPTSFKDLTGFGQGIDTTGTAASV
jgi:trigger factor